MPPEPARPHPGPWRIMDDDDWSAPVLVDADGAELYWLERVEATAADDALLASAPALRAALERLISAVESCSAYEHRYCDCPAHTEQARAALHAATAPAATGEPHA